MLAYFFNEPGALVVRDIVQDTSDHCYLHSVNLSAVFYRLSRLQCEAGAQAGITNLLSDGIEVSTEMSLEFCKNVARKKHLAK